MQLIENKVWCSEVSTLYWILTDWIKSCCFKSCCFNRIILGFVGTWQGTTACRISDKQSCQRYNQKSLHFFFVHLMALSGEVNRLKFKAHKKGEPHWLNLSVAASPQGTGVDTRNSNSPYDVYIIDWICDQREEHIGISRLLFSNVVIWTRQEKPKHFPICLS